MTRKSIVRAASVIAAGFLMIAGAPAKAAPSAGAEQASAGGKPLALTKVAKPRIKAASRTRKPKHAARGATKSAPKVAARKPDREKTADVPMSAAVANANAEMPQSDARGAAEVVAPAASAAPPELGPGEAAVSEVSNGLERAAGVAPDPSEPRPIRTELVKDDQPQAARPIVVADNALTYPQSTAPGRTSSASVTVASGDAWERSSLIGKIFIAFGGMLTLASAARMLIA